MVKKINRNSLDDLIFDLKYLEKHFDLVMQDKYDKIFACVIAVVGQGTSYDTGVSRDIIRDILRDLGKPELVGELDHMIYEFWNLRQERLKEPSSYVLEKNNKGRYTVLISEDGFNAQDLDGKVSSIHPRSDNRVVPHQIDNAIDLMETKLDPLIEEAFRELEEYIINIIEGGI